MSNAYKVAILSGDAIGPEIMAQAVRVFDVVSRHRDVEFELIGAPFGASAYFENGKAFPEQTKQVCDEADAILKGPVGLSHEESQKIPVEEQAERGAILPLRARYNTFANFRPIFLSKDMAHFSPLKKEVTENGIDILSIRELVGGLNKLIAYAQLTGQEVSLQLAEEQLTDILSANRRRITIDEIQRTVCQFYRIDRSEMSSKRRARAVVRPRQVAMYLSKVLTPRSYPEIGRKFGGRDHSTVIHAVRLIEDLRQRDADMDGDVRSLLRQLES